MRNNKYFYLLLCIPALLSAAGKPASFDEVSEAVWGNFFSPKTNLIYDYISSYENGKQLAHLPTAAEVGKQYPNYCGYGTGMEDCAISNGAMISAVCDWAKAKGDSSDLKEKAGKLFDGLELLTTVHGAGGFVARGVCVEDGKSVYTNTSRDQYTHLVHGVHKYLKSGLADSKRSEAAVKVLESIADRMIETVVPENDYDSLKLDGTRCGLGISRMWNVNAHEAARLPMIYAAAWSAGGNKKYLDECMKYLDSAIEQSDGVTFRNPAYALLQMQCSLETLRDVLEEGRKNGTLSESESSVRIQKIDALMDKVAELAIGKAHNEVVKMKSRDLTELGPDWRKPAKWRDQSGYIIPDWGEYRKTWDCLRSSAEAVLICQMAGMPREKYAGLLDEIISLTDYQKMSSCGIVYHAAIIASDALKYPRK